MVPCHQRIGNEVDGAPHFFKTPATVPGTVPKQIADKADIPASLLTRLQCTLSLVWFYRRLFNVFMQKLWSSDWQHVRYDGILVGEIFRGMQHQKRRKGGCSGGLVVASLKEVRGLLSRFDCVYSDCITQGCPGGALAVAMSLRARCFFFHTHLQPIYGCFA